MSKVYWIRSFPTALPVLFIQKGTLKLKKPQSYSLRERENLSDSRDETVLPIFRESVLQISALVFLAGSGKTGIGLAEQATGVF